MPPATKNEENVWKACCEITGQEGAPMDAHASLLDLGIDSLGLAELVIQLEEIYGDNCVSVDDILANPVVSQIAAKLSGGGGPAPAAPTPAAKPTKPAAALPSSKLAPTNGTKNEANVWKACCEITGQEGAPIDANASLLDLGIDSLGLAELVIQLEEIYGDNCINVDDVLANPIVSQIAAKLSGGGGPAPAAAKPAPPTKTVAAAMPRTQPSGQKRAPPTIAARTPTAPATPPMVMDRMDRLENAVLSLTAAVKALTPLKQKESDVIDVGETPPLAQLLAAAEESTMKLATPLDMCDTCSVDDVDDALSDASTMQEPPPEWIQTTHVGSLPRVGTQLTPGEIIEAQRAAGISIINDGEWSRENYIGDMLSRIAGVGSDGAAAGVAPPPACLCEMPCAADMKAVPTYAQRFTGGNGLITLNPKRLAYADVACTAMPKYLGSAGLHKVLTPFLDGLGAANVPVEKAFWSVPSPGTLAIFCEDRYFNGDHVAFVTALAEAMRPEYEAIAKAGIQLQVDCPDLAMGRHTRYVDMTDAEFAAVAAANVQALNGALRDIPKEQVRIHVCWGNYAGPHHLDINAYSVWPHVANVKCKYVLIEGANPRHGHEAAAFEEAVASGIIDPSELIVVPGVIDTTAARVEHPALVAERLLRFVKAAGHPSRVIASTDCGFASTARSVAITHDLAWRKIGALVEGAALATKLYLQAQAPVPMKGPSLTPTPYRCALICAGAPTTPATRALLGAFKSFASSVDMLACPGSANDAAALSASAASAMESLRWAVDFPIALVAVGDTPGQVAAAQAACKLVEARLRSEGTVSRRPMHCFVVGSAARIGHGVVYAGDGAHPQDVASLVTSRMKEGTSFDRRLLAPGLNPTPLPEKTEVVVIGGGLLGMVAAHRLLAKGHKVVVLEQRSLVGGIWSMHANSTSQVNSSEGGYCLKEFLPADSPRKHAHNRDHSTAAEVLSDLAELGKSLKPHIHTQVQVVKVIGTNGNYQVVCEHHSGAASARTRIIQCSGVVLAINDRVGMPRSLQVPGMDSFRGVMADGTSDHLAGVDWKGKRVVIFGMGAFAVENVRTALEHGASHVTVVARRLGTVCPKMIDYLNFVKPWDAHYRHETATNVKQLKAWRDTYTRSGASTPEVWPGKIKHDGHTISVSDIWFVAHHMDKMATHERAATLESMEAEGCVLSDGTHLPCDIVVGCIGFERNTTFCEQLTGRTEVFHSNYLDKNMIYLADAEIDETAFNSFFGSSVLEYAKFFTNVYVEGLERPDALGPLLWGRDVEMCPVKLRKWTQYIAVGAQLLEHDPACAAHAAQLVNDRTQHFYRTMPPAGFVAVNRQEWEELHTRLNNGVPVPKEKQLPYAFGDAAKWCLPAEQVLA